MPVDWPFLAVKPLMTGEQKPQPLLEVLDAASARFFKLLRLSRWAKVGAAVTGLAVLAALVWPRGRGGNRRSSPSASSAARSSPSCSPPSSAGASATAPPRVASQARHRRGDGGGRPAGLRVPPARDEPALPRPRPRPRRPRDRRGHRGSARVVDTSSTSAVRRRLAHVLGVDVRRHRGSATGRARQRVTASLARRRAAGCRAPAPWRHPAAGPGGWCPPVRLRR